MAFFERIAHIVVGRLEDMESIVSAEERCALLHIALQLAAMEQQEQIRREQRQTMQQPALVPHQHSSDGRTVVVGSAASLPEFMARQLGFFGGEEDGPGATEGVQDSS